ncbi:hypothetical protein ACFE04_028515 [Oxalis oulophora]
MKIEVDKSRDVILECGKWRIGDGCDVSIIGDKWILMGVKHHQSVIPLGSKAFPKIFMREWKIQLVENSSLWKFNEVLLLVVVVKPDLRLIMDLNVLQKEVIGTLQERRIIRHQIKTTKHLKDLRLKIHPFLSACNLLISVRDEHLMYPQTFRGFI